MPPTDVLGIFLAAILGIMDQQVCLSSQVVPGRPGPTRGKLWHSESRFMISDIGQRGISRRNPITYSRPGVADERRSDTKLPNGKVSTGCFVQAQLAREFP